ncbi:MAG TPA: 2TM domain-containing protein [Kribbella sp.]|nr:2TM domain-containing protein [Kribbella sp.]
MIDIQRGGELSFSHSLAAIFIGVSVGFGHQTLKWADKWAAHYLGGAPRPVKAPKRGPERARRERAGWYHHLLAYTVAVVIMIGLGLLSGRGYDAALAPAWTWTIVLVIDGIVSLSYSFGRADPDAEEMAPREKQNA